MDTDDTIDPHWHLTQVPRRTKRLVNAHKGITGLSQSMALADLVQAGYERLYGRSVRTSFATPPPPPPEASAPAGRGCEGVEND